jgi:hypothetical protein
MGARCRAGGIGGSPGELPAGRSRQPIDLLLEYLWFIEKYYKISCPSSWPGSVVMLFCSAWPCQNQMIGIRPNSKKLTCGRMPSRRSNVTLGLGAATLSD